MWPVGPSLVHLFEAGNLQVLWACWTWGILGLYVGNLRIEGGGAGFGSPVIGGRPGHKCQMTWETKCVSRENHIRQQSGRLRKTRGGETKWETNSSRDEIDSNGK